MLTVPLRKYLKGATEYTAEISKGYAIKKIGTDKATDITVQVDSKVIMAIRNDVAPRSTLATNLLGPLDVSDLPLIVPPGYKIKFDGASTDKIYVIGDLILLGPGESFPSGLFSRFLEQHNRMIQIERSSYTLPATTAWSKDDEKVLYTVRNTAYEKRLYSRYLGIQDDPTNAFGEGVIYAKIYVDGDPLDIRDTAMGQRGIEKNLAPLPPATTTDMVPFTLAGYPISLEPNHLIEVKVAPYADVSSIASARVLSFAVIVEYAKFPK